MHLPEIQDGMAGRLRRERSRLQPTGAAQGSLMLTSKGTFSACSRGFRTKKRRVGATVRLTQVRSPTSGTQRRSCFPRCL